MLQWVVVSWHQCSYFCVVYRFLLVKANLYVVICIALYHCLVWLQEDRVSDIGYEAESRDSILTMHTCFLIKSLSQREDHIRDIAENLLTQLRDRFPQVNFPLYICMLKNRVHSMYVICVMCPFPSFLEFSIVFKSKTISTISLQVLWDSTCLDSLLFSFLDDSSAVINDPAWTSTVRSLYQRIVREWIIKSLSSAPCTTQGLLQV